MGSLFVLRKSFGFVIALCTFIFSVYVHASPSHDWLLSQQSTEGAFENASPFSTAIQSTHEVLNALVLDSISSPVKISLALSCLSASDTSNTEVLARVISAQVAAGTSVQPLILELLGRQNGDGGFGSYRNYESDPLSTAFALRALSATASNNSQLSKAVGYILNKRQQDGGWKIDGTSSIALTAEVVLSLANQTQYQGVSAALAAARSYLNNQKKSDHTWGQTFESALAISALATGANTSLELSSSVQVIASRMKNNNWHGDAYTTALVLQAFKRVNSIGNAFSGKGSIKGQVLLVGSTQPVSGASVSVQNTNLQAITDASGQFNLVNVPEGGQTLIVSKSGFSPTSAVASVKNSLITDVGQLVLGQTQSGGLVVGKVFASGSLQAIAGATISLSGPKQTNTSSNAAGQFELLNLPSGNYNFTIESIGYHKVSGSFSLVLGQGIQINQALVSLDAPLVSDPASLSGKVIDGATGSPIANAQVLIDGVAATANSAGEFASQLVTRGSHAIHITASGYIGARYDITFPVGAAGSLGNLSLYKTTESELPTTLNLLATTVNSVSGTPVTGAAIKLLSSGIVVTTDASGNATLTALTNLSFNIEITAAGYVSQQLMVTASSFGSVASTFKLIPEPPEADSWSLTGVLRDDASQIPIAGAILSLDNGAHTALTDSDGHYEFSTIAHPELSLDLIADGYLPAKRLLTLGNKKGAYVVDLTLTAADVNTNLSVVSVTAPASVQPDSTPIINIEIENRGVSVESALVIVKLVNQNGEDIDSLIPYLPATQVLTPHIDFEPNKRVTLQVPWDVKQTEAGDYILRAEIIETGSINGSMPRGKVIAAGFGEASVEGISVFGGALEINPPLSQAGASTPIKLNALVRNTGNQLLETGQYELKIANKETGDIYHSALASAAALAVSEVSGLDFGTWTPTVTQLGEMNVSITRLDSVKGKISGSIYIGDVAKAEFTVDNTVLQEGDSSVKGKIRLSGVDTKLGASVDPLFVLVKNAVEKGATFTGPGAITWDKSNKCLGCHIQAQSLASLGSALGKTTVSPIDAKYLLNTQTTGQKASGSLETSNPSLSKSATLMGAWSLTEWPDQSQTYRAQIKALNFLWGNRRTASGVVSWNEDHDIGWLNNPVTATGMAALIASRTLAASEVITETPKDYSWGTATLFPPGSSGDHIFKSVGNELFVATPSGRLSRIDVNSGTAQIIINGIGIAGRINGLERDSDGDFWMTTENGRLVKVSPSGVINKNLVICSGGANTGGLLIDSSKQFIYAICHSQNLLKRINLSNDVIETMASGGLFNRPYGMAWAKDGSIMITNYSAANILKFDPITSNVSIFSQGLKGYPMHLTYDDNDNLFVTANVLSNPSPSVLRIRPDGTAERILSDNAPFGIVNHAGKIYVGSNGSANKMFAVESAPLNTSVLQNYKDAMPSIAQYLLNTFNIATTDNNLQAGALIGLAETRKILPEGGLRDQVDTKILAIANLLKQRQAPSGGWGKTGTVTDVNRDPLMTAWIGIALEYTSPSSQDPMVRNAITYLLNTQKANGSWRTNTGLFTTDLGTTSLVMVYMPKALDRIGGLDVKLTLGQSDNVLLSNPSIAPVTTTPLANGSVEYLWDLKGVTGNGRELTFDLAIKDLGLKEARPVSTHAQIAFANSFTDEVIVKPVDIPLVVAATAQTLDLQTNKSIYAANELVQIGNLVKNLGPVFSGGYLQLSIRSVDGNNVIAELAPMGVGALATLESQSIASEWNTVTTLAGAYEIYGQLIDSRNRVVAEDSASIAITATPLDGSALVGASLFTDKAEYRLTETVKLDATASNIAHNAILTPSLGKLRVVDSLARVVLDRDFAIPQLVNSEQFARQTAFELVGVDAGNYQASWNIYDAAGANLLASSGATFTVIDDPLQALLGKVTVAHFELNRGEVQSCDFVVTNRGTALLDEISLKKSVVSVEPEAVKEESDETLSLAADGSHFNHQLIATNGFEKGDYACVLEATIAGQTTVLATALFTVKESPIKLAGDISLGEKARLLVLVDVAPAGAYGEILYVKSLLDSAGWHYTMVDSAKDFNRELITGSYGAYALLSERITLTPKTRELLMMEVGLGDGLLVSNGHDRRHQSLEDALGIRVHSKQTHIAGIDTQQSPVGEAWSHTFTNTFNSMTFDLDGATAFGHFVLASPQNTAAEKPLGMASDFNVFVLDNYTSLSSTVEGRMAVGGNLNLNNFSVGDKLNPAKRGDVVVVGGDATFPSGRIYNGNLRAGGSVAGVGSAVRNGMAKGAVIAGNAYLPVEFGNESAYLQELSTNLAALPATGTVTLQWGGYELKGDCTSKLQVFNVNAAELATVHTYAVSCIPSGATVIFNILGEAATIQNMGMQSLTAIRDKVLFNFPQAKTVKLTSVAIEGSILAPYAEFVQPAGRIEGQVIAKSWLSTTSGYLSIHNRVFSGDVSTAWASKSKNALAYFQYQQGKTLFASFDVADHAYTLSKSLVANQQNHFADLLLNGLLHINPDETLTRAGKVVPVVITMANTGTKPAVGQATLFLSENLSIKVPDGFAQIPNTFTWGVGFSLAPEAQQQKTIYVQLPNTTGTSERIELLLQTGIAPDIVTQAEKALDIPIH